MGIIPKRYSGFILKDDCHNKIGSVWICNRLREQKQAAITQFECNLNKFTRHILDGVTAEENVLKRLEVAAWEPCTYAQLR